jgi:hypothetical protein
MSAPRVFLSFDPEHDRDLEARLRAEARTSKNFSIAAETDVGEMTAEWDRRTRERIGAADHLIALCGEHSEDSVRMSAELRIAQEQGKPYLLLWGRRECMCKRPLGARNDDTMYGWNATTLREQLQAIARRANPRPIPDSLKRQGP